MAKIKYNSLQDTIESIIGNAKDKGLVHLHTNLDSSTGRKFFVKEKGKELLNFGTLGYMGLEKDPRLIDATIAAVKQFGTQFSASRAYVSLGINDYLEELLTEIFGFPTLFTLSSSIGHIAVMPTIIQNDEAVILDQQVHASVQTAAQLLKPKGIPVEIIRHNRLDMLEEKIKELSNNHSKIWYMVDSVYSMYGDFAPLMEIEVLLNKYPQLHLYADDAHGVSWAGKNGSGYALSQIKLHPKMVLSSTLGKAFGVGGGIFVFPNEELKKKVILCAGPLTFSVPTPPPMVGAAIASAKIHLSDEIYSLQKDLSERIQLCNDLLRESSIPQITETQCPIFFIPVGSPATGYNLVNRLMKEGLFVNLAIFPAVAVKNTGLRFCISRHNEPNDIAHLVDAIKYHYPKALNEEGKSLNEVRKAFNLKIVDELADTEILHNPDSLKVEIRRSIHEISRTEWDNCLGNRGVFDWKALVYFEEVYKDNSRPEENWDFYYFIIRNQKNEIIAATFYTKALWKEDMLAPASVSEAIELKRLAEPYYLSSPVLGMGTFFSVGNHLYINKSCLHWKRAVSLLFDKVNSVLEKNQLSIQILRDFEDNDIELANFFLEQGFFKTKMPLNHIVKLTGKGSSLAGYLDKLSHEHRYYIKKNAINYEIFYEATILKEVSDEKAKQIYSLYKNVANKSFELNIFNIPIKLFENIIKNDQWEIIELKLKKEYINKESDQFVGFALNYKGSENYNFMITGIDYTYLSEFHIYAQILWQIIKRAHELQYTSVTLGLTASQNKRKYGAESIPQIAFVQAKDNFNMELINQMSVNVK